MSTLKTNNVQIGQSGTASNNFTWYQPSTPDGTVRLGNGNSGSVTDVASFTSAGVFSFNSGYGSVAAVYGCRAWVNFNGTGTVAIRASGGVTSITDNGTSDYTVNFTTTMPDANYGISGVAGLNNTSLKVVVQPSTLASPTTSAVRIQVPSADGSLGSDPPIVCVSIFR